MILNYESPQYLSELPKGSIEVMHFLRTFVVILSVFGTSAVAQSGARILAMGDSFLGTNSSQNRCIPSVLAKILKEPVRNRAVSGARIIYKLPITGSLGFNISRQYRKGP
jgi:acyl-CoA thioesterase-1